MATLANFPPELLLRIFSHLGYRDLVCARRTCVQWRDLSMEEGLLRTIKNDVEEGVELDMNTLLTYNGRGHCGEVRCWGKARDRYGDQLATWGETMGWRVVRVGDFVRIDRN